MRKIFIGSLLASLVMLINPTDSLSSRNDVSKVKENELLKKISSKEKKQKASETLDNGLEKNLALLEDKIQLTEDKIKKIETNINKIPNSASTSTNIGNVVRVYTVNASAYGSDCVGCSGRTASGTIPKIGRTVAVDPNLIPLGTWLYIEFPTMPHLNGKYRAEDTGGAIKGAKIDLFLGLEKNTYAFGRRTAIVKVLR